MVDTLVGTWRYDSSTNDEQIAQILSFPVEKWQEIKAAKPEVTYTKLAENKFNVKTVDILNTSEADLDFGDETSETISKFKYPDGKEGEVKIKVTRIDETTWKEVLDYGMAVMEVTKKVDGDVLTHTFTCKELSGTFVFKRV